MGLETSIAQEIESQDIIKVVQGWAQEWKLARERGFNNTLRLLSKMYDDYKDVKAQKKPSIESVSVDIYGRALEQLKQAVAQNVSLSRYRFLFPALDTAYAELIKYVGQAQEVILTPTNKQTT